MANILAMNVAVDKRLGPYIARSYSRFYPDVKLALRPEARGAAREIANLWVLPARGPQPIAALIASFDGPALATSTNSALGARLAQNTAAHPVAAPVIIAQGVSDVVVPPPATDAYVDERCAAGRQIKYWKFAGLGHAGIVQPGTSLDEPIVAWTTARLPTSRKQTVARASPSDDVTARRVADSRMGRRQQRLCIVVARFPCIA
jgi:hypothetical protein